MKGLQIIISSLSLLILFSCSNDLEKGLQLKSSIIITSIPSASGVLCKDGNIWLVGDDVNSIFELNNDLKILNQYEISKINNKKDGRILKSLKADFESMDAFENKILILGSGSKEISRDTAVLFDTETDEVLLKKSIRPLYDYFLHLGNYDSALRINIEGLASCDEYFYLLQRGNIGNHNDIFRINKNSFLEYLNGAVVPDVDVFNFELPKIESYRSGFSGACISPDKRYLLFTSSVESTLDVYHDGEVLGSFIGVIPLQGDKALKKAKTWPLGIDGKFAKTKIESICVRKQNDQFFELLCVSDNDNGESGIYRLTLNLN